MSKELVLETLMNSPEALKGEQIAEKAGVPRADVDKAIKALRKEGKVESPKRCFYAAVK